MSDKNDGVEYLWCLHCEHGYKKGEYRWEPSQWCAEDAVIFREEKMSQEMIEMALEPVKVCPYAGCDGDVEWDGWPWERIRKAHADYPEVPEEGRVYPLY